jgi:hypothetical protein
MLRREHDNSGALDNGQSTAKNNHRIGALGDGRGERNVEFFGSMGQSRRFGDVRVRAAFPLIATEQRKSRHVSNGPQAEMIWMSRTFPLVPQSPGHLRVNENQAAARLPVIPSPDS